MDASARPHLVHTEEQDFADQVGLHGQADDVAPLKCPPTVRDALKGCPHLTRLQLLLHFRLHMEQNCSQKSLQLLLYLVV